MPDDQPLRKALANDQTPGIRSLGARQDFPGAEQVCYLNAAGIGLVPAPVQDELSELIRSLGSRGTSAYFERYEQNMELPRAVAARLLSAPLASVAIITSISEAISQIAWWRKPGRGENVVLVDIDCSPVTYPWLRVARETGAQIRFVEVKNAPERLTFDAIARLVDKNTAVICVSHVQWITGYRVDLNALSELAKANGALLVIDAMHSTGVVPFNAAELAKVDFLVTGAFKWLCGYAGAGAVYVNPDLLETFQPVLVGGRSSVPTPPFDDIDATHLELPPDARRFEYGSSIVLSRLAFARAVQYLLDIGIERIFEHNLALSNKLFSGLRDLGAEILTPGLADERAAIVCASFVRSNTAKLYDELLRRDVVISLRAGRLRFSPHFYNSSDDIDRALEAVKRGLT